MMSDTTCIVTQITCAFCKGTAKDTFDLLSELAVCQVCGGTGKVEVKEPVLLQRHRRVPQYTDYVHSM